MTPDQITAWAAAGESATLEFKKSTAEKDRACRSLCAFANGQGGRVLFGVTPAGKVVEWSLVQFIDVACELDHLNLDVKKFGHALPDFRHYTHPYEQMSVRFNPDKHTAEIRLQVLKAAIASLSRQRT